MFYLGAPTGDRTLVGYILPRKAETAVKDEDESDSEEEDEDEPEFLDFKEMSSLSSGGLLVKGSYPRRREVDFQDTNLKKKCRVVGRFTLLSPWWEVTSPVRQRNSKVFLLGFPFYSLRTELGSDSRAIISLFLKACKVTPEHVTKFMDWLPDWMSLNFSNLRELLKDFGTEDCNGYKAIADSMLSSVNHSSAGRAVWAASMHPYVMKYLPVLLPRQFENLVAADEKPQKHAGTEDKNEAPDYRSLLGKLEEVIKTDVWKLGFSSVTYKELGLIRCEATWDAFWHSGLLPQIPDLQRCALMLYDKLKRLCRSRGSTFVYQKVLSDCPDVNQSVKALEALRFLTEQEVVVQEKQRVFLRQYYRYETGIAKCVGRVVAGTPWRIDLDVREALRAARPKGGEVGQDGRRAEAETESAADGAPSDVTADPARPEDLSDGREHRSRGAAEGQAAGEAELDPDQVRAAAMICANPVTVISGKGGCGKTTVVSLVFRAALKGLPSEEEEVRKACEDFENDCGASEEWNTFSEVPSQAQDKTGKEAVDSQEPIRVLLTAPTGRAASLLKKRTGLSAYTLHQVVWSFMQAKKAEDGAPKEWKFAKVQAFVVDEGSLVSVQILHSVLNMLVRYAQLKKLILLGDVRQLPSIEPGNVLADMFSSLSEVHWAVEMKTNHRAESQLIVNNAGQISDMGKKRSYYPLEFDATVELGGSGPSVTMPTLDKSFVFICLPTEANTCELQDAIKLLLKSAPGLTDHNSSQFIAFRRKDCDLINELCCKHYSGHNTRNHKGKLKFQPGDKVCCTKNGNVLERTRERDLNQEVDEKHKETVRLCNGEIFFITRDEEKDKKRYLTLVDGDCRELCVWFRELQRECRLKHAWARTIHTFQGSEAETIVYALSDGRGENWQHIYTAVTRGRRRVYVVGNKDALKNAVERSIPVRNTQLKEMVRKELNKRNQATSSTPHRAPSGPSSTPSTSLSANSQRLPQDQCSTTPLLRQNLLVRDSGTADVSLLDDIAFSQAYSWSPMDTQSPPVPNAENAGTGKTNGLDSGALPGPCDHQGSSGDSFRNSETDSRSPCGVKRQKSTSNGSHTPSKISREVAAESPLSSSRLQSLSLASPSSSSRARQLFPPPPPED
ncbi:DNA helicase B [Lepisosteus oculatus]|uniref:DNA helicase B n=1 Tax=Lepisosteus oculatus TaxID=7918 RepID=UPI0037118754